MTTVVSVPFTDTPPRATEMIIALASVLMSCATTIAAFGALIVTPRSIRLPASVRLIASALPAFTATPPAAIAAAATEASVVPFVITLMDLVTFLMFASPTIPALAFPSKYTVLTAAFTPTAPTAAPILISWTVPKFMSASTVTSCAFTMSPASVACTSE